MASTAVSTRKPASGLRPALLACTALCLLVLSVWLPFGLRVSGTHEEWLAMQDAESGSYFPGFAYHPSRPLGYATFVLGHFLTPGSFVGLNLIQAALLSLKACLTFAIVDRLLPGAPLIAFLAGGLAVFLPADRAVFTLRAAPPHAGVVLYLASILVLFRAVHAFRWRTVVAMVLVEATALASYDAGAALLLWSGAYVFWSMPADRSRTILLVAWSTVPILFLLLEVLAIATEGSFFAATLHAGSPLSLGITGAIAQMSKSAARAYATLFFPGWSAALKDLIRDPAHRLLVGIDTLIVLATAVALAAGQRTGRTISSAQRALLATWGFSAILVGFLPYLPTNWPSTHWRVYAYASLGMILVVAVVAATLTEWAPRLRWPFAVIVVPATLGLGVAHAIDQHSSYVDVGERQQEILAPIIEQAPALEPDTFVLLLDLPPHSALKAWESCELMSGCLTAALRYAYARSDFTAAVCALGDVAASNRKRETCRFDGDGIHVHRAGSAAHEDVVAGYSSLAVFESRGGRVRLVTDLSDFGAPATSSGYDPGRRVRADAATPPRALTLFSRWPFRRIRAERRSVRFEFDRPMPDPGWSGPEESLMWTDARMAMVELLLAPRLDYRIEFAIERAMSPEILASLALRVNDRPIELAVERRGPRTRFSGTIPQAAVARDPATTRLVFTTRSVLSPHAAWGSEDTRELGVRFDWLEIAPASGGP